MAVLHSGVTFDKAAFVSKREAILEQVHRLTNARVLHGSESLCKLLRYLTAHSLDHPGIQIKEYQIATEVFGRPADFDPQSDSAIRVQAGRLRAKLSEYYASEGASDPIVVELPRGSYALSFHERVFQTAEASSVDAPSTEQRPVPSASRSNRWLVAFAVVAVLLIASLAVIVELVANRRTVPNLSAGKSEQAVSPLQVFWQHFAKGPEEPWVIFSNAAFVGRPETGMRYYDAAKDANASIWDHYTGVGEVLAIHNLDQAFTKINREVRIKRGSLFSLDDAENTDLIFVGSPSENLTLQDIPNTREFVFQRVASGPRKGDLGVVNVHPAPGEPTEFVATPSGTPLTDDYAVIGFMPGLNPARSVMILAGTTTFGTQGAVEYVSRENSVQNLLSRLAITKGHDIQPFEALLHVKIKRGVPVESDLVAIRKRQR
jgi:hypothetical protein